MWRKGSLQHPLLLHCAADKNILHLTHDEQNWYSHVVLAPCAALLGDIGNKGLKEGGRENILMPENWEPGTGQDKKGLIRISARKQQVNSWFPEC